MGSYDHQHPGAPPATCASPQRCESLPLPSLVFSNSIFTESCIHLQSVPGTRQHFTKILCGYNDSPKASEKKAAAKEKEKKPVSRVNYKPFTGAFEL
jgi:hypothetical protein